MRYLNSVNFADIGRFMKLKCLKNSIKYLGRLFMKIELLKIGRSRNISTSKQTNYTVGHAGYKLKLSMEEMCSYDCG